MDNKLPPLPASDADSIQTNQYHGFYKLGSRDFWGDAEITSHKVEDFRKCVHYFMRKGYEIECNHCHIGWQAPGAIQVLDGQLIVNGEIQSIQL